MNDATLMGVLIVVLCLLGLSHDRRLLTTTRKGQRLIRWFGEARAIWILRGLLAAGAAFGVLLATGVIRPVEW